MISTITPPPPPKWTDVLDVGYFCRRLLITRGWIVLIIAVIVGCMSGLIFILMPSSYTVTTMLRIKPDISFGQSTITVGAESSLLASRKLVDEVLQKLDRPVDVRYKPAYFGERVTSFFSVLGYWKRKEKAPEWLSLTPSLMVDHFTASELYYGAQLIVYVSDTGTFEVFDKNNVSLGRGHLGKMTVLTTSSGRIEMTLSRPKNSPPFSQSFILFPRSKNYFAENLSRNLVVKENSFLQSGGRLTLTFKDKDPYFAQQFVQMLLDHYMNVTANENLSAPKQVLEYLTAEVNTLEQRITEARAELAAQRLLHQSIDIPTEARLSLEQGAKLQSDLMILEQDRRKMAVSLAPDNPALKAVSDQMNRVRQEITRNKTMIDSIPLAQKEIVRLERDIELMVNLLERTKDEQRKAETQLKGIAKHVEVLQFPNIAGGMRLTNVASLMLIVTIATTMGGFLYLLLGAIPAFARITAAKQLEQFTEATLLHVLPRSKQKMPTFAAMVANNREMLMTNNVKSPIFLVTSLTSTPKSCSFASAIAIEIAQSSTTLFVDANIKKPCAKKGLTDVLLASFDVREALHTSKNNLTVLFSGTPTPSYNLLNRNGGKVPKLIATLSQGFNSTVVSWPALAQTAANFEVLTFAQSTIIFVQRGDKLHALKQIIASLSHAGITPLYLVLQK